MVEIASGACSLCHKSSTCYTHAINMDERSYKFLCDVDGMTIQRTGAYPGGGGGGGGVLRVLEHPPPC